MDWTEVASTNSFAAADSPSRAGVIQCSAAFASVDCSSVRHPASAKRFTHATSSAAAAEVKLSVAREIGVSSEETSRSATSLPSRVRTRPRKPGSISKPCVFLAGECKAVP